MRLLHITSSPRGTDSVSITVGEAVVEAYRDRHPDVVVDTLDVWGEDLPEFDAAAIGVKYKLVSGEEMDGAEADAWRRVERLIERVEAADRLVVGVPMWNWGVPYKLKQFVDLVCQRGRLFEFDGRAYAPALDVARGLVVAVRGQSHETGMTGPPPQDADYHLGFVRFWLQAIGVRDVRTLVVEHTWDSHAEATLSQALAQARELAAEL